LKIVIGTRGSELALAQTRQIAGQLSALAPNIQPDIEIIRTTGDVQAGSLRGMGGQGVFTKELEKALIEKRIDVAVHSLKDLPSQFAPELYLVATPQREDVRDVIIADSAIQNTFGLPKGAKIGTGSARRQAQLRALRPDLNVQDIRGNLDTRIKRVTEGDYEAVILAAAGLHRLKWNARINCYLTTEEMLPAAGQGAIGLQMLRDHPSYALIAELNDNKTFTAVTAERKLLRLLRGGCHSPIAAWAREEDGLLLMDGRVGDLNGQQILHATANGPTTEPEKVATEVAQSLIRQGADHLIETTP
jgi:hydroxymethylbilane synthase